MTTTGASLPTAWLDSARSCQLLAACQNLLVRKLFLLYFLTSLSRPQEVILRACRAKRSAVPQVLPPVEFAAMRIDPSEKGIVMLPSERVHRGVRHIKLAHKRSTVTLWSLRYHQSWGTRACNIAANCHQNHVYLCRMVRVSRISAGSSSE